MNKYQIHYSKWFVRSSMSYHITSKHKSLLMLSAVLGRIPKGHVQFCSGCHYFAFLSSRLPKIRRVYLQNAAISFLPTAIILQSVGRDVPGFGQRVSSYPPNLRPCFKNKVIYRREKNRMVERYHRMCVCVCVNAGAVRAHIRHFIGIRDFLRDDGS